MAKHFILSVLFCSILACLLANAVSAEQIDINSATLSQLDQLTGIGPIYAQRIIDDRPYASVDDLLRIKGIGPATLQKIKDQGWACVNCQTTNPNPPAGGQDPIINPPETNQPTTTLTYPSGVVINEILPSATGDDEINEWIEIFNSNNFEIDLSDWSIRDTEGTAITYTIPIGTKLAANSYLVLTRPLTKIVLNNSGDKLELLQPNNNITDSVTYPNALTGQSYNKTSGSWTWSATLTPGADNIVKTAGVITNIKSSAATKPTTRLTQSEENGISNEQMTAGLEEPIKNLKFTPLLIIGLITAIIFTVIFFLIKIKKLKA